MSILSVCLSVCLSVIALPVSLRLSFPFCKTLITEMSFCQSILPPPPPPASCCLLGIAGGGGGLRVVKSGVGRVKETFVLQTRKSC
jgi:hypothetical protein